MIMRGISDDICCHYLAGPKNKPKNKQNRKKIRKSLKWKGSHYFFAAGNKKGVRDTDIYSLRPSCMRLNHHLFSEGHIYYQLTSHKIFWNIIFSCPSSSVPNIQTTFATLCHSKWSTWQYTDTWSDDLPTAYLHEQVGLCIGTDLRLVMYKCQE